MMKNKKELEIFSQLIISMTNKISIFVEKFHTVKIDEFIFNEWSEEYQEIITVNNAMKSLSKYFLQEAEINEEYEICQQIIMFEKLVNSLYKVNDNLIKLIIEYEK